MRHFTNKSHCIKVKLLSEKKWGHFITQYFLWRLCHMKKYIFAILLVSLGLTVGTSVQAAMSSESAVDEAVNKYRHQLETKRLKLSVERACLTTKSDSASPRPGRRLKRYGYLFRDYSERNKIEHQIAVLEKQEITAERQLKRMGDNPGLIRNLWAKYPKATAAMIISMFAVTVTATYVAYTCYTGQSSPDEWLSWTQAAKDEFYTQASRLASDLWTHMPSMPTQVKDCGSWISEQASTLASNIRQYVAGAATEAAQEAVDVVPSVVETATQVPSYNFSLVSWALPIANWLAGR